jgi:hypothetical protein
MVTMLLFAKTAFANPRWLRGARRFAGFLAPAPNREAARKAKHEASLAVFTLVVFAPAAFAPTVFAARTFTLRADASRTSGGGAPKSAALVAQLLPARFSPAVIVDFFGDIEIS